VTTKWAAAGVYNLLKAQLNFLCIISATAIQLYFSDVKLTTEV